MLVFVDFSNNWIFFFPGLRDASCEPYPMVAAKRVSVDTTRYGDQPSVPCKTQPNDKATLFYSKYGEAPQI